MFQTDNIEVTKLLSKARLLFKFTSTKIVFLLIAFLPVFFLYQNCGQPGFMAANNSESYTSASTAGTSHCLTDPTDAVCSTHPDVPCTVPNGKGVRHWSNGEYGACEVTCDPGSSIRPKDDRCLKGLIIMPLGDSLTFGLNQGDPQGASGGYRYPLLKKLQAAYGQDVYFVGSERNGPLPENRHQGHPGYNTAQIADVIDKGYLEDYRPNIIVLMIGTNDIALGLSRDEAPNRVQAIIQKVFSHLPAVHLIVASIPPQPMDGGGFVNTYNERIRQIVLSSAAQGVRVSFADVNSALSFADVYNTVEDSLHMNSTGYSKIADVFFGRISALNLVY